MSLRDRIPQEFLPELHNLNHVKVTLDAATHTYRDDLGRSYVSVTTLLGADGEEFDGHEVAERCSKNARSKYYGWEVETILTFWQASADLGTQFHRAVERWIKTGELPKRKDSEYESVLHFTKGKWKGKLQSETILHDVDLRIAGTADIIEVRTGVDLIHDVKTCRTIGADKLLKYSEQLEIYCRLRSKMTGKPAKPGVIVWYENFVDDPNAKPVSLKPLPVSDSVDDLLSRWSKALELAKQILKESQ